MKNKLKWMMAVGMLSCSVAMAQQQSDIMSVSASTNVENAALAFDKNMKTMWTLPSQALKSGQWLMLTIQQPGDVCELELQMQGIERRIGYLCHLRPDESRKSDKLPDTWK